MKPAEAAPDGSGGIHAMPSDCLPPPRPSSRFAYGLRPDLHVCRLDSTTVFLDIEADRYFALTGEPAETFWRLYTAENLAPAGSGSSHAASQQLADLDLVRHTSGPHAWHRPDLRPPPIGSAYDGSRFQHGGGHLNRTACLSAYLDCLRLRHWRSFRYTVAKAQRWKARQTSRENLLYEAIDQSRALHRLTPFLFTRHDACLFRSLFLVRYLQAVGIPADWEFGVRCAPFCAHCWVEYDGIVLNDHQETVLAYRKILSI